MDMRDFANQLLHQMAAAQVAESTPRKETVKPCRCALYSFPHRRTEKCIEPHDPRWVYVKERT